MSCQSDVSLALQNCVMQLYSAVQLGKQHMTKVCHCLYKSPIKCRGQQYAVVTGYSACCQHFHTCVVCAEAQLSAQGKGILETLEAI